MHISDILKPSQPSLSFEFFPPRTVEASEALYETIEELKVLLCNFADVFDLSLVDEYTYENILEVMDMYCLSLNDSVPVF